MDAVLLEGFIVAPLTSSPIRADRLWAQEREYIIPRIRIVFNTICKDFFPRAGQRDDFMSLGGWTEMLYCMIKQHRLQRGLLSRARR